MTISWNPNIFNVEADPRSQILVCAAQEDLAQYQAKEDEDAQEVSDEAEDSDAESTNSFNKIQTDSEDDAPKRRSARVSAASADGKPGDKKAQAAKAEADKAKAAEPKPKAKENKAIKAKQDRAEKVWSAATKAEGMLSELNADMIWRNVVRLGEVERRLAKAGETEASLRIFVDTEGTSFFGPQKDAVKPFLNKLAALKDRVTDFKDFCREIRAVTPEDLAKDVAGEGPAGEVSRLLPKAIEVSLNSDDHPSLMEILCFVAKKLHTVAWLAWPSIGTVQRFWKEVERMRGCMVQYTVWYSMHGRMNMNDMIWSMVIVMVQWPMVHMIWFNFIDLHWSSSLLQWLVNFAIQIQIIDSAVLGRVGAVLILIGSWFDMVLVIIFHWLI